MISGVNHSNQYWYRLGREQRPIKMMRIKGINHLLLLGIIIILQQEAMSFQQQHISTNYINHQATISKITTLNLATKTKSLVSIVDDEVSIQKQMVTSIFLSSAFGMCLIGSSLVMSPQLSNAAELSDNTRVIERQQQAKTSNKQQQEIKSITNYARQVFGAPLVGSTPGVSSTKPVPTDPKYTTREERNRAYDEAFQQDARDRDGYYGKMAMKKRQEADQSVSQYREKLGLDGKGDTRMRVGEEKVQGMSSLRDLKADYNLSQQDDSSSTTIPAE